MFGFTIITNPKMMIAFEFKIYGAANNRELPLSGDTPRRFYQKNLIMVDPVSLVSIWCVEISMAEKNSGGAACIAAVKN